MTVADRHAVILKQLETDERVTVRQLAELFGVSEMTVRRDLSRLQQQGLLVRTHGGGTAASALKVVQSAFPAYEHSSKKEAIGRLAAGLVSPGQTIMVDSGTTVLEVAKHLPQDSGIVVATTSLCVAQELHRSSIEVLLLGGFVRKEFPSVCGPMTEKLLSNLRLDVLFVGCDGADSVDGFYMSDMRVSDLEQAMIRIAQRVVVVTESTKFGRRAFVRYAEPGQVHTVVTDSGLSGAALMNLEDAGVTVLMAEEE